MIKFFKIILCKSKKKDFWKILKCLKILRFKIRPKFKIIKLERAKWQGSQKHILNKVLLMITSTMLELKRILQ